MLKITVNTAQYVLFLFALFISCFASAQSEGEYRLAPDDQISVKVFDEPDLSLQEVRISSNGSISMPLIGSINVQGLTIGEAEQKIHSLYLGDYLKKPNISIAIIEYRQFYVDGAVGKPGGYSFREGMTVQRAIALAGGFTERAAQSKITIVRENSAKPITSVSLNQQVKPGDVITVAESFF
jgi:polysaccharide export outer membrane protein